MNRESIERSINPENLRIVDSLAEPVGNIWQQLQERYTQEGEFFVASPLSSTPLPIYAWIHEQANGFSQWGKVKFVLMDEMLEEGSAPYSYVPTTDLASYEGFAEKNLLLPLRQKNIGIRQDIVYKPDLNKLSEFDDKIEEHGGIDLLILALGPKGNYANVMPGTSEETGWHVAHLIPEFRQAHTQASSASYAGAQFREYGMSLGPKQVLTAKHILVIISGAKKRDLTNELFSYTNFNPDFPLSIVHHPELKKLKNKVYFYITKDVLE